RLFLGVAPACDVDVRDHGAAFGAAERLDGHLEPALAVRGPAGVLEPGGLLLSAEDGGGGLERAISVGIAGRRRRPPDLQTVGADREAAGRIRAVLGEALPRMVDGDDHAVAVDSSHLAVERAEDGAPERVALEHSLERGVERGDVDDGADVADEAPVLADPRHAVVEDPPILAVAAPQGVVDGDGAPPGRGPNVAFARGLAVGRL